MTQDTRKDRRVKIVSLNVRYKSATVDEFIENHSHDVSKGGIFIKTASPFPPGTLLKFEIRLSDDQSVIAGVGRVVWKRDGTIGSNERPSGMGVKFIKIDDPSKTVIDKLVSTKADAGKAYDAEPAAPDAVAAAAATPAASPVAVAAASTPAPAPKPMPAMQPTPPGGIAAPGAFARKATMMGIGGIGEAAAAAAKAASSAPAASGGAGMFPVTNSQADMPPKQEQTVMKQAAELLEEALKEAGGSMDEIGQNPLFATGGGAIAQTAEAPADDSDTHATLADTPSAKAGGPAPKGARTSSPPVSALAREAQTAAAVAKKVESVPPTARESPSAKTTTVPPTRAASFVETVASDKKKGNGTFIGVLVAVAAVAAGVYVFRDSIFPAPATVAPPPVASQPTPPPSATASAPTPTDTASASAAAPASAAPSASASTAPTATAPPTATQAATAIPTATARPTATQTAAPTATARPTATATAQPTATQTAAPTATQTAAPKPTATATAAPKPKPTSDNPY